jgi:hypothetical protein
LSSVLGASESAAGFSTSAAGDSVADVSVGGGVVGVSGFGVQPRANSPRQTVVRLNVINFFMVEVSLNLVLENETKNQKQTRSKT